MRLVGLVGAVGLVGKDLIVLHVLHVFLVLHVLPGEGSGSVGELGLDELAVEAGDIAQRDVLGTLGRTGTGIGAVAETELVHLAHHGAGTTGALHLTLGQEGKLAHLSRDEEHSRAVLAGCHTGAAADTGSRVHGLVGDLLGDGERVGILGTATVDAHIAAGLLDLVESVAVDHEVAYHRERCRAPGLDSDGVLIIELTHVQLAGGDALHGAVGMTVDVERAHAADAFAAVAVKDNGFLALVDELLVEHVEHLEERAAGRDVLDTVGLERTGLFGRALTPDLEVYVYSMFHCDS